MMFSMAMIFGTALRSLLCELEKLILVALVARAVQADTLERPH